jgi:hypothetical protein
MQKYTPVLHNSQSLYNDSQGIKDGHGQTGIPCTLRQELGWNAKDSDDELNSY